MVTAAMGARSPCSAGTGAARGRKGEAVRRTDDVPSIDGVTSPQYRLINHFFHDFKGALSTVIMCIDAVREGMEGEVPERQGRWLGKAERNCQHLVMLIDDFRDLTRMEDGSLALEAEITDPTGLLARLSHWVADEAARRRIEVSFDLPSPLPGACQCSPLVGRVLDRAYGVLVDCTRTGGRLDTTGRLQDGACGQDLVLEVRSEGVEVDAELLPTVFDLQDQTSAGLQLGRGYTMLFCRAAARYVGGDLALAPWPGRGTTMELRLPLKAPAGS
jgi:signal transduction histidine kinase